jgi:hypothetical protein
MINDYNMKGVILHPTVVPENPNMREQVGNFIYPYVEKLVGEERAPKVAGMLLGLTLNEIKGYLYDFR